MKLADDEPPSRCPSCSRRNAASFGSQPGMREKDRGIWQSHSWRDCHDHVRSFALGLAAHGFKRGDKLSVLGDNRPRLYWAQLAAQALGGMSVPLYQDSIASELVYVLDHAEVSVVVAEDQEQVDKVLSLRRNCRPCGWIIYEDPRGMSGYRDPMLKSFAEVEAMGRAFGKASRALSSASSTQGRADDVALIAYTSGTTGQPKGVLLSHRNMIATAESFVAAESVQRGDNWLCYLPMGWVGDVMFSLQQPRAGRHDQHCPESPETVQRDLRELGPHALLAPPRIWESMLTAAAGQVGRRVVAQAADFHDVSARVAERRELLGTDGKPVPLAMRVGYRLGECRGLWPGARPAGPAQCALVLHRRRAARARYVPLLSLLRRQPEADLRRHRGQRACRLPARRRRRSQYRRAVPCRARAAHRRQRRGAGQGARRVPRLLQAGRGDTRDAVTPDGWLKTGDAGIIDPRGHLAIIDRAKDVGKLD